MQSSGFIFRLLAIFIILTFLAACTADNDPSTETLPATPAAFTPSPETSGYHASPSPDEATAQPTTEGSASSTSTPELAEIDWRDVPIMPEVSQRVLEIYQVGQTQGRDPHSFSVIGDCQAIPFVFMGPYERGELEPDPAESYLWEAINFFKGSFTRWGVAARGGFTAASLLTPIQADPHYCKPGETPLTCEYRLHNPAYVFITLETWLDPNTIDRYEVYLREIMDYVIEHGSVPILLTKADSVEVGEGRHVINPAIVRVARDYDVPLVNFWRAAQYIDNFGIDPTREGFHLSQEGYDLKNTLALRALYAVWQAVENGTTGSNTNPGDAAATPTPSSTPISLSGPQVTPPDCIGGCIFFGTAGSRDGAITSRGVYAYNYLSRELTRVLGEGFDLQDVSEDGQRLLANQADSLYEIDLAADSTKLVSESFVWQGKQGAYWNRDDSAIVLIDQNNPLQTESGGAFNLFPTSRDGEIYFDTGTCSSKDFCQSGGIYRLNLDQTATRLDLYTQLVFSPGGEFLAFLDPSAAVRDNYYHIGYLKLEEPARGIISRRIFYFPDEGGFMVYPDVRTYAFSPQNNKLFIIYDVYSAYFESSLRIQTYLIDLTTGILYDFGKMSGLSGSLNPRLAWAPQGNQVLLFLTAVTPDDQFSISIYQTDLESGERLSLYDEGILVNGDYIYITNLYWR